MARHGKSSLFALALTLGGFAACTFSADDFEIVPDDGAGGSGASSSGGSQGNVGGDNDDGGANNDAGGGGTDAGGGSGLGGEPAVAGAGGAGTLPRFSCSPLAQSLTVFTPDELEQRTLDGEPLLITASESVVVMVSTQVTGSFGPKLFFRAITDSNGGMVDQMDTYGGGLNGNRLSLVAGGYAGSDLKVLGISEFGLFQLDINTTNGGRQFIGTLLQDRETPDECDIGNGTVDGYVRDAAASFDSGSATPFSYAMSCASQGVEDFSLWYTASANQVDQIAPPQVAAVDHIVRQYTKIGDTHFMLVGGEVGPTTSIRVGSATDDLRAVHAMALSEDPNVWSTFLIRPQPDGLFLHGVAFTTDEPNPAPLVPAEVYDGSVSIADVSDLFMDAAGADSNVPPSPLQHTATFTKASELVGVEDALPVGTHVLLAGASVSPRDSIHVSYLTSDGSVLAPPTEIYQAPAGATIDDKSVRVARLGIGFVVVWAELGEVKARVITCLQD